ncbi:MAG: flagellar motor protein MotB [Pseudomonadota bacterium]|nr:flagellar motor protein MotB [Pseudomonadota bacterium]
MADAKQRPIVIVKRKRGGGHAHHGGAWKVAYADFVTAMMAFFMVMWLVASVSKEQRAAIFDYFKNPSMQEGHSVKPAPGQMGPGGASTSPIDLGGGLDAPKTMEINADGLGEPVEIRPEDVQRIADLAERKQLESLMEDLREAIDKSQALEPFKDQLLLDITPEGLRIQIVDKQNRPMFDLGGTRLKDYTAQILREVAAYLNSVPNRISLSGHTDDKAYVGQRGYSNWDLSADRANAARRALQEGGLEPGKVARVVGLASSVLFDRENPHNPINRRISIIVMTKSAEARALSTDAPDVEGTRIRIESGEALSSAPPVPSAEPATEAAAQAAVAESAAQAAAGAS